MRTATHSFRSATGTLRLWLAAAVIATAAGIFAVRDAAAQNERQADALTPAELTELVGPIALYPDDLVALVLPASTYPLQVVEAARFLDARAKNSKLEPDSDWDDSVVALLNYPEVVRLMNDDLDWTYDLGEAVLNQRPDVLDAIQGFRERAADAGNLRSDDRQTVATATDGTIAIKPADPQVIYVPYYEPERVVVYQTVPVFHYYPWSYPVYYYPYPAGYTFSTGWFWGVTSWFSIGWDSHLVHVHHYGYRGHPYYGWNYYDPFYVRRDVYVDLRVRDRGGIDVWQPRYRYGGRPLVRGRDGYVAAPAPRVSRAPATGGSYRNRAEGSGGSAYRSRAESSGGSAYRSRADGGAANDGSVYRSRSNRGEARLGTERAVPGNRSASGNTARTPTGQPTERYRSRPEQPQRSARTTAPQPQVRDSRPGGYSDARPRPRFDVNAPSSGRGAGGSTSRAPAVRTAPSVPNAGGYRGGVERNDSGARAGSNRSGSPGGYRGGQSESRGGSGRSAQR